MSSLETRKIEPLSGTTVTLGASGDAVTMPAGVTVKTNTVKDAGGNTIWTSDGSGTISNVNSGLKGGMTFISSQTASSSASIAFTSGLNSTYDEYVFYFVNMHPASDNTNFTFQGSTNGGGAYAVAMTTTFFWSYQQEGASNTGLAYHDSSDQQQGTSYQKLTHETGADADQSCSGELHLFAPSSTSLVKHFYARVNNGSADNKTYDTYTAGYFNTTSAINAISFKQSSGNLDSGDIYLFGIK